MICFDRDMAHDWNERYAICWADDIPHKDAQRTANRLLGRAQGTLFGG